MADHKIRIVVEGKDNASGALKSAGGALDNFGKGARDLGGKLTGALTLPLIGIGAVAIKMSTDLNAAMANVASLGVPTERVNELKTAVQDMSIAVGKSTDDLAGGLYQVISAFGDTADTTKILEINAKAGAAGLATTLDAINLTSAVTKGYGDTSAEAVQKASDLAFVAVQLGQTTFPELASSVGKVVPLTNALGVSQEELFATMATATGVTGNAAEVSTQLRGVLQSLMAPTGDMTGLMGDLGYANGQAMIDSLGLKGTIDAITKAAKATGMPLAKYIGSIEGQTLALTLAGSQSDTYADKLAAMGDATGATDAAFTAQTGGINALGFAMAQARQKVAVLTQNLGDALGPILLEVVNLAAPLVDKLLDMAKSFTKLSPATKRWVVIAGGIAAAIGPALFLVGSAMSALLSVVGAVGGAFALLLGPVGLVVAALGALWAMDFGGFRTKVSKFVVNFIKNIGRIPAIANNVIKAIQWIWQGPEQAANIDWWGDITGGLEELFGLDFGSLDELATKLSNVGVVAGGVIEIFKNIITGGEGMSKGIADAVSAIGQATGATVDVTAAVTTVDWGSFTYKYDATTGITRIDWNQAGLGTFKYDSTTGIVSIDWTGSLSEGTRQAFSYDSEAGIKLVKWNEEYFDFTYDAAAEITTVDFGKGLFKGTYDAIANITSVGWGVYQHFYSTEATIIRVAWGAYEHLYDAQAGITEDNVLWGVWSNVYDANARIAEASVLWGTWTRIYDAGAKVTEDNVFWGAWSFTYDAKAQIKESDILWGLYTNTYDVNAKVGESGVLWGLWTWEYSATAGVKNVTFAGGLGKKVGDWFKNAIESGVISIASITAPDWVTKLLDWKPSTSDWVTKLLDWKPSVPDWVTKLLDWKPSVPGWVTKLLDWKPSTPGWVTSMINWKPGVPDWVTKLLNWVPSFPPWLGGGGTTTSEKSTGTRHWRGGPTWVGEKGAELVNLPRGSQIFNHERSMAMAGSDAGGATYNVTFAPVVNSDIDLEVAFDRLLKKLGRRRP